MMNRIIDEYRYLLALFVYIMKNSKPHINTVYRLIYIYRVSMAYLSNSNTVNDEIVINQDAGVGDYSLLQKALGQVSADGYVQVINSTLVAGDELGKLINNIRDKSIKAKKDLQRIAYFVDVVSSYGEDVIMAIFFKEPNVADASDRNKKVIKLTNNKLVSWLTEFEKIANTQGFGSLDKYDVFIRWLDFVLDQYLNGKC